MSFGDKATPGARICLTAILLLALAQTSFAQLYPSKLIRLVTGSSAGGAADVTARQIAPRLAESLKQQIIVDNRPGVAGMVANEYVSKAAPDGYTILFQPASFMIVTAILNAKGAWDPTKSLVPAIQVAHYGFVVAAHPSVPAKTIKELIAVARARPKGITFASTGVGSNFHLAGALFALRAKAELWHVPYKGSPQAIVDLISGRVDTMFTQVPPLLEHLHSGRLRALGVTGARENPLLPGVPTIADAALPGYEIGGSEWIMAPAGTPREALARLNAATTTILDTPELKDLWRAKGNEFSRGTPDEYAARFKREYDAAAAVIREAGIKPETGDR